MGLVHGLAGSAAVAILVMGTLKSPVWGLGYLLIFGAGTLAGMLLITLALALPLRLTALAGLAFLCLPRQFHVAVVEHDHPRGLHTARWLFPLYMLLINVFVIPIALAGLVRLGGIGRGG